MGDPSEYFELCGIQILTFCDIIIFLWMTIHQNLKLKEMVNPSLLLLNIVNIYNTQICRYPFWWIENHQIWKLVDKLTPDATLQSPDTSQILKTSDSQHPLHPMTEFCVQFWLIYHGNDHLIFYFNFWRTQVHFVGPLIPLFWTSGDVCPGFHSQGGSLFAFFLGSAFSPVWSSDSPLVWHLLTAKRSAWQPSLFDPCTYTHVCKHW